jgi:hypothetical protein
MPVTRSLVLAACAAGFAFHAARAEIFDHLSMSASPSTVHGPVGKTVTIPIRLHAFWGTDFAKTHSYYGRSVNDHYSLPAMVTLTCRS